MKILSIEYEEKNRKKKNIFALTRFEPTDQRQVIYSLHYKYRIVITDRTVQLNYSKHSKIFVCFYTKLRFKTNFVIDKYLYKQRLSIQPP